MECPKCSKLLPDDAKWCPYCGEKVSNNEEPKEENVQTNNINNNEPLFVAHKSTWQYGKKIFFNILIIVAATFIGILAYLNLKEDIRIYALLVAGAIDLICVLVVVGHIMLAHASKIIFYRKYVVVREGIFNTKEKHSAMTKIIGVNITQTLLGKIFNYGNIYVDKIGEWDINLEKIHNPKQLKKYIESYVQSTDYSKVRQVIDD